MWPSSTSEQAVRRFRSSAFDIFRVSRRNRLHKETDADILQAYQSHRSRGGLRQERPSYMVPQPKLTWLHCSGPGRRRRAPAHRRLPLGGSVSCREAESHTVSYRRKVSQREACRLSEGWGTSRAESVWQSGAHRSTYHSMSNGSMGCLCWTQATHLTGKLWSGFILSSKLYSWWRNVSQ